MWPIALADASLGGSTVVSGRAVTQTILHADVDSSTRKSWLMGTLVLAACSEVCNADFASATADFVMDAGIAGFVAAM